MLPRNIFHDYFHHITGAVADFPIDSGTGTSKKGFGKAKDQDVSTGPLAHPFARLLAPLTRLLTPACSLHLRSPLHSLTHYQAHEKEYD